MWKEEGPSVESGDTRASEPQSLCSWDKEARARRLRSPRRSRTQIFPPGTTPSHSQFKVVHVERPPLAQSIRAILAD
ncbi:hypothetical protein H8959_008192 [Pygathrix nigripes]